MVFSESLYRTSRDASQRERVIKHIDGCFVVSQGTNPPQQLSRTYASQQPSHSEQMFVYAHS